MDSPKDQLVEKLKSATNILVTVSRNPSVDQLAACVGLTVLLNKFGKHATAVFSGEIPSTLEFLQPENTLEKNTDSLRDFIIALDKSKADKLRYKVEDEMVRIFITPFRVSLTDKDLEFSQGDFNVDVVIALGVTQQEDFDAAITAHGRILHDAVVSSISTGGGSQLGSINWSESNASSLSEVIVSLAHALGDNLLDTQVATALLTGIVSETQRFSNEKTTPQTMSISAELMAAGANQQLVATKLDTAGGNESAAGQSSNQTSDQPAAEPAPPKAPADGTLEIDHDSIEAVLQDLQTSEGDTVDEQTELPAPEQTAEESETPQEAEPRQPSKTSRLIVEPPTLGGTLTANSSPEGLDPANDALGIPAEAPPALLNRPSPQTEVPAPTEAEKPASSQKYEPLLTGFTPPPPLWVAATQDAGNQLNDTPASADAGGKTLAELESEVHSTHGESLDTARDEVLRALSSQPMAPEPVQSLGAQPLGDPLRPAETTATGNSFTDVLNQVIPPAPGPEAVLTPLTPFHPYAPEGNTEAITPQVTDPNAPPPVPPPIPFNFGTPPQQ
ncbi:MAG: hypothetical protein QFB87_00380 [Patescibacteria group bacterium]|nr:hypothetical protein [Patescibacteria group bacterium]